MVFARGSHATVGGTSAGKALHLVELGVDVALATVLGDDDEGRRVESALRGAGVPLLLERATPTERHLNLMAADGGRVSIYLTTPPEPEPGALDAALAAMPGARALVLDLSPRAAALLPAARATGVPIWTDLHDYDGASGFHAPFREAADYVFCNADKLADPVAFLHAAVAGGARVAVCTLGADGAVAVDATLGELRVAAVPVPRVVDVNGAGDGFAAGFLAATLEGADTAAALRAGARQAARALASAHLSPLLDR
ncbi:MAG: carbohydrate kinase family protein [Actinomycetales bacterium]|nr:carbohydrate kinase family protein [Actinomycetales bacterium]